MSLKIVNNIMAFVKRNGQAMDLALNKMAVDVERLAKQRVPHNHGQLQSSIYHLKLNMLKWTVRAGYNGPAGAYARFQEFGGDGKRVVRKYSKPGKQKFYLRDSGNEIAKRAVDYFKREADIIRI